jgi:hypothetical protein
MLNSELLKTLECASSSSVFKHITRTPIALSCGHVICKECIIDSYEIVCIHCNQMNFNDLSKSNESLSTKSLFSIFLGQLFSHIEECFKDVLTQQGSKGTYMCLVFLSNKSKKSSIFSQKIKVKIRFMKK